ncbi:MAG: hypothetical protein ACKV0T_29250, partial [Planctomycetales bacterium]
MSPPLEIARVVFSVRWVRGYRYLDRCGEALVRLEERLDNAWIVSETAPSGGSIRNDVLEMQAVFNSASLTVQQEGFSDFGTFCHETHLIYDILRTVFEIGVINAPAVGVTLQLGMASLDESSEYLIGLSLVEPASRLVAAMGKRPEGLSLTVTTAATELCEGATRRIRRRFNVESVTQATR